MASMVMETVGLCGSVWCQYRHGSTVVRVEVEGVFASFLTSTPLSEGM